MSAGPSIKFTVLESVSRLSKRYLPASDGKSVIKESFTQLYEGCYQVAIVPAGDIPAALQTCGKVFDALTYKHAITLGVPRDGSTAGLITTQDKVREGTAPATAIPRDLEHFGWPERALLFLDGDDRDGLYELLCGLYPALAKVAALARPSVSACVAHPVTGKALKTGEHVYVVIDKPVRSHDCLHAIMRLAWVHGQGAAAGWLALSIRGDVLIRGPIDAIVGSPERLSYEGAGKLEDGLKALPRDSRVTGGSGMVDADDLIAYADQQAPEQRFREMVDAAKNDPTFMAACAAAKADYRAAHIKKGAAQRLKKDPSLTPEAAEAQATESFDATEAAGTCDANGRVWIPLADDHVLYFPDGKAFTVADIKADPTQFNDKECCDPAEGMDYQSRNCAVIYTNYDDQIQIYSRAHGDAFAYVASLDGTPWAVLFARITGVRTIDEVETTAFSEDAIALEFTERHRGEVRYTAQWGKWHLWDGQRWVEDRKRKVFNMARALCREASLAVNGRPTTKRAVSNNKTKMGVLGLAMDDQRTAAVPEQWDADIWKLCTPGGIVDLQTGKMQPAVPGDYCTMMTSVAPGGSCPLWMDFLNTVTEGDQELIRFLQVCCGYALTGSTREQILLFLWGRGGNGKSVFIETITGVMGDYHTGAAMDTFVETRGGQDRHPTDMAGLRGARLVTAAETEQGRRWAESKIKTMTGGDKITARFMRQDFFTYVPQYTLMIYGNFKPGLKSVDEAIRRRMKLIPFTVTIPKDKRDKDLITKLKAEWGGILKWMIEGCMIWQRDGLATPQCVEAATAEYLHEEDLIGHWIEECCTCDPQALTAHSVLFDSWKSWAESARAYIGTSKQLASELKARNFASKDMTQGLAFIGLKVANRFDDLADTLFMDLLKGQKGPVSPNKDDENYAPKVFASQQIMTDEPTLAAAMQRLLKSGKIKTHGTAPTLAVAQPK